MGKFAPTPHLINLCYKKTIRDPTAKFSHIVNNTCFFKKKIWGGFLWYKKSGSECLFVKYSLNKKELGSSK